MGLVINIRQAMQTYGVILLYKIKENGVEMRKMKGGKTDFNPYESVSGSVQLVLHSDGSVTRKGFRLRLKRECSNFHLENELHSLFRFSVFFFNA